MSVNRSHEVQYYNRGAGVVEANDASEWGIILGVSAVALFAIGCLVAGGVMVQHSLSQAIGATACGVGGGLLLIDLAVGSVLLYLRNTRSNEEIQPSPESSDDNSNIGTNANLPLNKPQKNKQSPAAIFSKTCEALLPLPTEMQFLILQKIDALSLVQLSATCTNNWLLRDHLSDISPKARLEIAALKSWQESLISENSIGRRNHLIAQATENLFHFADFCLNQIEKILDSIQTLPHKAEILMRIASALGGMHSVNYDKVKPTLVRFIQIITQLNENEELDLPDQQEMFARIFKSLCNDLGEALNYSIRTNDQYKAYFDIAESFLRTGDLKAFDYIKKIGTHERGPLFCQFLERTRLISKEKTSALIKLVSNQWDILDQQWTEIVACELAQSYMFIDDFDSACALADKVSKKGELRIIEAIAIQCDPKMENTYQILTQLLAWIERLNLNLTSKDKNSRYIIEAKVAIAVKMSKLNSSEIPSIFEIWDDIYISYKEDAWAMLKMIECFALSDISEAKCRALEIINLDTCSRSLRIDALIIIAKTLSQTINIENQQQAADLLELALLECDHLPKDPCTYSSLGGDRIRFIDCCYVESLAAIAQCYAKIDLERAKEIFAQALIEFNKESYPQTDNIVMAVMKTYAILDPEKFIQRIQNDKKKSSENKAFILAETAYNYK